MPVANPYYDPMCNPDLSWCEPPQMPGTPFISMGMEAFNDTPLVNGTVYPTVTIEPKSYRFRILNAANDRFFNLSLYVADASGKEVALNAAEVLAALADLPGRLPRRPDTVRQPCRARTGSRSAPRAASSRLRSSSRRRSPRG